MSTDLNEHTEAILELPDLTNRAAILTALSQLLQAVALNQIDTKRANLLLRGLSLATRLAAAIEKQENTQESNQAGAPGLASETWVLNPAPISQEQTIAAAETTTPPSRPAHHIAGYHALTRRQKLAARRAAQMERSSKEQTTAKYGNCSSQ